MLFNSLTFPLFFAVVFIVHRMLPAWRARKNWLLFASYLFYAAWYPPYVAILLFSTTLDWYLARRISLSNKARTRKMLLIVSLAANLLLLGFFKYGGFALENAAGIFAALGIQVSLPPWNIALPIGISFYTFASLSYTIDVYRGEMDGRCGWRDYALFVSFFPHLVAGPIVRARQLVPQIQRPRAASADEIRWGLTLAIVGLFAKTLADAVFAPVVEQVYASQQTWSAVDAWAAVLGFSAQIYFDFSGYSLCAIGLALCLGFHFPDNFNYPYAANGFSDFWRRWHITLSSWLRDYLYIPLGGNREGPWHSYRNLMITMLLAGLWHGASWMFVLWGGLHGLYLAIERFWRRGGEHGTLRTLPPLLVFMIVTLTWIPFRAPDTATLQRVIAALFHFSTPTQLPARSVALVYAVVAIMFIWQYRQRHGSLEARFARMPYVLKLGTIAACLALIFLFSGGDERAFLYFQF